MTTLAIPGLPATLALLGALTSAFVVRHKPSTPTIIVPTPTIIAPPATTIPPTTIPSTTIVSTTTPPLIVLLLVMLGLVILLATCEEEVEHDSSRERESSRGAG